MMTEWLRKHRGPSTAAALGFTAIGAWLVFGFFGVHTLFFDDTVNEANPFAPDAAASGRPDDRLTPEQAADMNAAMADTEAEVEASDDDTMTVPEVETLATGHFVDRSHAGSGTALLLTDGTRTILRIEDLDTDNGPDLNVYLSTAAPDADAASFDDDFVDLGDLKGNIGDQNYDVPDSVDLSRFRSVVIWCVRFGVAFTAAPLASPV